MLTKIDDINATPSVLPSVLQFAKEYVCVPSGNVSIISRNGQTDEDESDDDEYGQFDDYGPRAVDEPEGQ